MRNALIKGENPQAASPSFEGISYTCRCTFKSLSVSKKKTATQMVDPLNFRFMDARLKNVASFRRRRDATQRVAFSFPVAFFPSLPVFFFSHRPVPFRYRSSSPPIDASVPLIGWVDELCRKYNKPPPLPPSVTMHTISTVLCKYWLYAEFARMPRSDNVLTYISK